MALACGISQNLFLRHPKIRSSSESVIVRASGNQPSKRCLRCNTLYLDAHNSPTACSFHGHATRERGLFALAPPHQGIDREWSDRSGVKVYKWNEKNDRPNTGPSNRKRRCSCCAEYEENTRLVNVAGMFPMTTASPYTS